MTVDLSRRYSLGFSSQGGIVGTAHLLSFGIHRKLTALFFDHHCLSEFQPQMSMRDRLMGVNRFFTSLTF